MILFPNSKINLGLRVIGKRPDGYHNLETVFYPVPLNDALEIIVPSPKKEKDEPFQLTLTGIEIPGTLSENICYAAWKLIKRDYPDISPVKAHLHKTIPTGAGLGGGSSDGSHTLILLNKCLELGLSQQQLIDYALELGSDCPFFMINKPCIATGRGELMEEMDVLLHDHYIILVNPGIHINTAWAFSQLSSSVFERSQVAPLKDIIRQPVKEWKHILSNDFEEPVFSTYPVLYDIKDHLYASGAVYASMTGTGSSIYGLFSKNQKPVDLQIHENHQVYYLNKPN